MLQLTDPFSSIICCPAGSEGSQLGHLQGAVPLGVVVHDSKDVGDLTPNDGVVTYVLHVMLHYLLDQTKDPKWHLRFT